MSKNPRRGYAPNDEKEFDSRSIEKLYKAGHDLYYLLNQGYNKKSASVFVGNHYLLTERQRIALVRTISSERDIQNRRHKEITEIIEGSIVNIDGFNTIITLEVALSNSVILKCMDGTIRDLAALRGNYHLIDKTDIAITMIGEMLEKYKIRKANFFLDAPVSNSGKLKVQILELLNDCNFDIQIENIKNVDATLEVLENVITTDSVILDRCKSWINLNRIMIERNNICVDHTIDFSII